MEDSVNKKVCLICGISGQDGSYLAEYLLSLGYKVHGVVRRSSSVNRTRIDHLRDKITLHYGDMCDSSSLIKIVLLVKPDEIYNLAAQSHVRISFDQPEYTNDVIAGGNLRLLEAVRLLSLDKDARYYHASSSEMFGASQAPQTLTTRFYPRSPYACAKVCAHEQTINYREGYGLFAVNGILFNHCSERRGENFFTRKLSLGIADIYHRRQKELVLGNLQAKRDIGYAKEYVKGMWLMLQHHKPDDYILATGKSYSMQELVEHSFNKVGLDWQKHIMFDPKYLRPSEVDHLQGDASHAKNVLGWEPTLDALGVMDIMVENDLQSSI